MEPNKERVKAGFLAAILKNALPGALTNLALMMLIFLFSHILGLSAPQRSTIAVAAAGVTGLMILALTSRPLTPARGLLLLGMGTGLLVTALLFGRFFLLVPLAGAPAALAAGVGALSPVLGLSAAWPRAASPAGKPGAPGACQRPGPWNNAFTGFLREEKQIDG